MTEANKGQLLSRLAIGVHSPKGRYFGAVGC